MKTAYDAAVEHMLPHSESHGDIFEKRGEIADCLSYITEGRGSFTGCVGALDRLHEARATYYWLKDHNADLVRYHASVAVKLIYIRLDALSKDNELVYYGYVNLDTWFYLLVSDQLSLTDWYARYANAKRHPAQLGTTPTHAWYAHCQIPYAVLGDYATLRKNAQRQLDTLPPKLQRYAPVARFYVALANGDVPAMDAALAELASPKSLRAFNNEESGITRGVISTWGVTLAKLAWRAGHAVRSDSLLVPNEWLPIAPLKDYVDPYDFMKTVTVP